MIKVILENGKYVWSFDEQTGRQEAFRHDELWRDLCGDNLTLAMGTRIEELTLALTEAIEWIDDIGTVDEDFDFTDKMKKELSCITV